MSNSHPNKQAIHQRYFYIAITLHTIFITLLLTLSPFNFSSSTIGSFKWSTSFSDAINNVFLFIPIGFFVKFIKKESSLLCLPELFLGAILSFSIEVAQLFLASRQSQFYDIFFNALGAWSGALIYTYLQAKAKQNGGIKLAIIDTQLLGALLLLTPSIWLNGINYSSDTSHMFLLPLPAIIGSSIIAIIIAIYIRKGSSIPADSAIIITIAWLVISTPLYIERYTEYILVLAVIISLFAYTLTRLLIRNRNPEIKTLKQKTFRALLPILSLYLILIAALPLSFKTDQWLVPLTLSLPQEQGADFGLYLLEISLLCIMSGYLLALIRSDKNRIITKFLPYFIVFSFVLIALLSIINGFQSSKMMSFLEVIVIIISLLYGGFISNFQHYMNSSAILPKTNRP